MDKPLITKEHFVMQLTYLKDLRKQFDKLNDVMEDLSPGFRVDFLPNITFETKIIELLNFLMNEPADDSLIEYFVYENDFGDESDIKYSHIQCHGQDYDISTPEALYDTLVALNFPPQTQDEQ